jgi:hypothetical protein
LFPTFADPDEELTTIMAEARTQRRREKGSHYDLTEGETVLNMNDRYWR